jgi:hypothetical protein
LAPSTIEITASVLFGIAIIHTFFASTLAHISHRFPKGSVRESLFHLLGEVEVTFGLWAAVLVLILVNFEGPQNAIHFVENLNFTEPLFVFAIMAIAATRPILHFARTLIDGISRALPFQQAIAVYLSSLIVGPLIGSLITEPAAMTVTALLLKNRFFDQHVSTRFKYLSLAVLFVNVSVGGVLTSFAAPPVLMVAAHWNWDSLFMFTHFGWKAILIVVTNTIFAAVVLRKEFTNIHWKTSDKEAGSPIWLQLVYLLFLFLIVITAHHSTVFMGIFLFFLGVHSVTRKHNEALRLRESLLVALFLAGLVTLGGLQQWWLKAILEKLNALSLFLGASALTAITDNAALTYLGSQVPNVSDIFKYALVAGAVTGGGLTVIANAPNPAGFSILQHSFGRDGISAGKLFVAALIPTFVALIYFWFL